MQILQPAVMWKRHLLKITYRLNKIGDDRLKTLLKMVNVNHFQYYDEIILNVSFADDALGCNLLIEHCHATMENLNEWYLLHLAAEKGIICQIFILKITPFAVSW